MSLDWSGRIVDEPGRARTHREYVRIDPDASWIRQRIDPDAVWMRVDESWTLLDTPFIFVRVQTDTSWINPDRPEPIPDSFWTHPD